MSEKYLILFDFDSTLTDKNSYSKMYPLVFTKELKPKFYEHYISKEWYKFYDLLFDSLKSLHNIGLKEFQSLMQEIDLSPGMFEFLYFLKKRKEKFYPYVLTSNIDFLVESYTKDKHVFDVFYDIIGEKGVKDEVKNELKITETKKEKECDLCKKVLCKSYECEKLVEKYGREEGISFEKVIFVCDGENDFCLGRNLKESDVLFVRKNEDLYKKLINEGWDKQLKCEVIYWENANEIQRYVEKLK